MQEQNPAFSKSSTNPLHIQLETLLPAPYYSSLSNSSLRRQHTFGSRDVLFALQPAFSPVSLVPLVVLTCVPLEADCSSWPTLLPYISARIDQESGVASRRTVN